MEQKPTTHRSNGVQVTMQEVAVVTVGECIKLGIHLALDAAESEKVRNAGVEVIQVMEAVDLLYGPALERRCQEALGKYVDARDGYGGNG
jgi:hypothetical protein